MDTPFPPSTLSMRMIHVLLLEDSETNIALIRDALAKDRQISLTVARTLAEAHARLAEMVPDLVIADLMLPDGKGTELLPADTEKAAFPIVVLTGSGNEKEAVEAMKAGALDYLVKSAETLTDIPRIVRRTLREWGHIVERKLAENAFREGEERLRSFFNSSAAAMVIISPEGEFIEVNPACCRLFGYAEDEMVRLKVGDVTHPEDREEMLRLYEELLAGRLPVIEYEKRYLRKDGSILWGHVTVSGVYDPHGKLIYLAGQMQEITERKRAEEALRESEERFRSVFNTAAAGMIIISPTGRIQQANPAFCRFIGQSEAELAQLTIEGITHPEDRDMTSLHYGEIFAGQRQHLHYEKRYLRKDGQTIWGHASVACVMTPNMQPIYCVGLVQDITERKQMEEELRKANRELDAFVHTISHDLRSPLTPIIGYTEFLREQYRERLDEQAMNILAEIHRQGHRMLGLLEDLLALAKAGHLERPVEPVDCYQVVEEVVAGLASQIIAAGMAVQKESLPTLRVPKTLLAQLFDNLIGNAVRYAGKEGGPLEVGGARSGTRVRLYVRDHGAGIPAEERSRVFDLFYRGSTGENAEGTGVGLATVQKIAHLFGGRAWVEETPGGGSTFWVEMVDEVRQGDY